MEKQDDLLRLEELYWQISRRINAVWKKVFDETLPGSQAYLLYLLEKKGVQKVTGLAGELGITPGAITSLSDKLISRGYISRVRDRQDRRIVYLEITPQGKEILQELRLQGRAAIKSIFSGLEPADLKHLVRIFEEIAGNIDQVQREMEDWNS